MFNRKQCFVVGLILSLAALSTHAASTQPVSSQQFLYLPQTKPGPFFDLSVLWLKPGASNLNYVILNKELPAESPAWKEQEIMPDYSAGYQLGGGYVFCQGQDVSLFWTHLGTSNAASIKAPSASFFLGPDYEIGPPALPITQANGNVKFNYDVVNLDAGQLVAFGDQLNMRFFAGLSYAYLKEIVMATYRGTRPEPFPGPFALTQNVSSLFTGIGPRLGLHGDYMPYPGLSVFGEGSFSALIGGQSALTTFTSFADELLVLFGEETNRQSIGDQRVYQVIPGFEAKLGMSYKYAVSPDVELLFLAGYQAAVYVNAISQYLPGSLVLGTAIDNGGVFVATMNHTLSNYSVHGPFLNFLVKF